MASLTRVHPVAVTTDISGPGPDTAFIEVDYLADVSGKTGPESTQAKVKELLSGYGQAAVRALGTVNSINLASATAIRGHGAYANVVA